MPTVNQTSLAHIAHEYVTSQHMPKVKGTLEGFKLGMAVFYLTDTVNALVEEHTPMLKEYKIMDSAGNVDLDKLRSAAEASLEMNGGEVKIPKMEYVANKEDLEALLAIAKNYTN